MGPLTFNGIISTEWNYVIALLIGMAFGFILEASGFSSSRKLIGVFYGYDFVVLRVFFTAVVVAIIGLLYLDYFGFLDFSKLYVVPTYLNAEIAGSVIMGFGFVMGGFCPGTSLTAVAIGKLDGWAFTIGLWIGILGFSEAFPYIENFYNSGYLGHITVMDYFNVNPYWFTFAFTVVAIVAFTVATMVRRRVKKVEY
jgi:uncharacterized protein